MPTETLYTIADLSRLTGVSVRTIRYYLAQGLLPAPGETGPGAHYGEGHLHRLQLTKRLQAQHQPLSEIRNRLATMSDEEVATAVEAASPRVAEATTSALDYVRGVLAEARPAPTMSARSLLQRRFASEPSSPAAPAPAASTWPVGRITDLGAPATDEESQQEPPPLERSQWERLSLGPNIELNVRRPLSRQEQKRVERLITIARQVLKEDKP